MLSLKFTKSPLDTLLTCNAAEHNTIQLKSTVTALQLELRRAHHAHFHLLRQFADHIEHLSTDLSDCRKEVVTLKETVQELEDEQQEVAYRATALLRTQLAHARERNRQLAADKRQLATEKRQLATEKETLRNDCKDLIERNDALDCIVRALTDESSSGLGEGGWDGASI